MEPEFLAIIVPLILVLLGILIALVAALLRPCSKPSQRVARRRGIWLFVGMVALVVVARLLSGVGTIGCGAQENTPGVENEFSVSTADDGQRQTEDQLVISLTQNTLMLNETVLPDAPRLEDFVSEIGQPTRVSQNRYDGFSYEDLGLSLLGDPASGQIVELRLQMNHTLLNPAENQDSGPLFSGVLLIEGHVIYPSYSIDQIQELLPTWEFRQIAPTVDVGWYIAETDCYSLSIQYALVQYAVRDDLLSIITISF